jgi:hypothetical protein
MALLRGLMPSACGRCGIRALTVGLVAVAVMLLAVACGGEKEKAPAAPVNGSSGVQGGAGSNAVKVYSSPT